MVCQTSMVCPTSVVCPTSMACQTSMVCPTSMACQISMVWWGKDLRISLDGGFLWKLLTHLKPLNISAKYSTLCRYCGKLQIGKIKKHLEQVQKLCITYHQFSKIQPDVRSCLNEDCFIWLILFKTITWGWNDFFNYDISHWKGF